MQFSQKTSFISIDKCLNTINFPHLHSPRHGRAAGKGRTQERPHSPCDNFSSSMNPITATQLSGNTTLCWDKLTHMLLHWNIEAPKAALPSHSELRKSAKENENGDYSKFSAPADTKLVSNSNPFSHYLTAVYPNGSPLILGGYLKQAVTQFLNSSPQHRTSLAKPLPGAKINPPTVPVT